MRTLTGYHIHNVHSYRSHVMRTLTGHHIHNVHSYMSHVMRTLQDTIFIMFIATGLM